MKNLHKVNSDLKQRTVALNNRILLYLTVAYKITKVTLCVQEITVSPRKKIGVIVIAGEPFLTHSVMPVPCNVSVR